MTGLGPTMALTGDGCRLHLQHGPIDLLIEADGSSTARATARDAATARFDGILEELVAEIQLLRTPLTSGLIPAPKGKVALRMVEAVVAFRDQCNVTPMAAVAGAVADEIGAAMEGAAQLDRWMVNNGGDISVGLSPGHSYTAGVVVDPRKGNLDGTIVIESGSGVGGIATSGRHGRSFSLGIADAVTVTAQTAAAADAAATVVANAVDLGPHGAVQRVSARDLDPDSDLGDLPVTVDVGVLTTSEIGRALDSGLAVAESLVFDGVIVAAVLHLQGRGAATASMERVGSREIVGSTGR